MQNEQLASLIRWHRRRVGLSQVELARFAGVSRYVEQDLETGTGRTAWGRVLPVLQALNLRLQPEGPLVKEWLASQPEEEEGTP